MSVYEMADVLIKTGICDHIDSCPSTDECYDFLDSHDQGVPQEMCRECMIKWLTEEG